MPVYMLQFSRIETHVGNMYVGLFIISKTSQIYKSWSLHGFYNNSNWSLHHSKSEEQNESQAES